MRLFQFLLACKQHTTEAQLQDLVNRRSKGYLDRELHEKANTVDEKLTIRDLRFLSMITRKEVVKVPGHMRLEQQAQDCAVALFVDKLNVVVALWLDYRRSQQAW